MTSAAMQIIYNPSAGRGRAVRQLERFRSLFGERMQLLPTERPGHAEELALEAARKNVPIIGAAGGDGTVHEVANGVLRAGITASALAVLPSGSADDYASALRIPPDWAHLTRGDIQTKEVDVGLVRVENGQERFFVNGLGLGFNGAVTVESRKIRWLRGMPLYGVALLRAVRTSFAAPKMVIHLDDVELAAPTLALSVNLGKREGAFTLTPNAILDDGWFDYLHAGDLSWWQLLGYLPRMISGSVPQDDPKIRSGRCRRVEVASSTPVMLHVDGEFLKQPPAPVKAVKIRLLPKALRVVV